MDPRALALRDYIVPIPEFNVCDRIRFIWTPDGSENSRFYISYGVHLAGQVDSQLETQFTSGMPAGMWEFYVQQTAPNKVIGTWYHNLKTYNAKDQLCTAEDNARPPYVWNLVMPTGQGSPITVYTTLEQAAPTVQTSSAGPTSSSATAQPSSTSTSESTTVQPSSSSQGPASSSTSTSASPSSTADTSTSASRSSTVDTSATATSSTPSTNPGPSSSADSSPGSLAPIVGGVVGGVVGLLLLVLALWWILRRRKAQARARDMQTVDLVDSMEGVWVTPFRERQPEQEQLPRASPPPPLLPEKANAGYPETSLVASGNSKDVLATATATTPATASASSSRVLIPTVSPDTPAAATASLPSPVLPPVEHDTDAGRVPELLPPLYNEAWRQDGDDVRAHDSQSVGPKSVP